jgi:copper(I)-binding protein
LNFSRVRRMARLRHAPLAAAAMLAAFLAAGAVAASGALLAVSLPWVRPAADGRSAELFLEITSTDGAALVGAGSPTAGKVTLLGPGKAPKPVSAIALPANAAVQLAPGGYRIALTRLARPLKIGDHVPVSLAIETVGGKREELLISAEVRLRSAYDDEMARRHKHEIGTRAATAQ